MFRKRVPARFFVFEAEIIIIRLRRIRRRIQRDHARIRNRSRRKPRPFIRIVGVVDFQIVVRDDVGMRFALYFGDDVFDRRARIQADIFCDAVFKHACNERRFVRDTVFPLDDGRENERRPELVGRKGCERRIGSYVFEKIFDHHIGDRRRGHVMRKKIGIGEKIAFERR